MNSSTDVRRIAFVTRRFHELQGLLPAGFGGALLVSALVARAIQLESRPNGFIAFNQFFMFAFVFAVAAVTTLQREYRRTLGATVTSSDQRMFALFPTLLLMVGGFLDFIYWKDAGSRPSIMALGVSAYAVFVVLRDFRWRSYYIVSAAAGVMAAIVTSSPSTMAVWVGGSPTRLSAFVFGYTLIGVASVVTGLLDHALLTRTFFAERAATPRPRRGTTFLRSALAGLLCAAAFPPLWFSARGRQLALPLFLGLAALIAQVATLAFQSRFARDAADTDVCARPSLYLEADTILRVVLLAVAVALDAILPLGLVPLRTIVAAGVISAWVAWRDWPKRAHYLIGAVAPGVAAAVGSQMDAAGAVAMLLLLTAGAVVFEGFVDYRLARPETGGTGAAR